MKPLRLGTRGSQLALFQARLVADRIRSAGGPEAEIVIIRTTGDRVQDVPLSEIGGKRLFVKEIEDALLSDAIDLAVHSAKDMSAVLPDGLVVGAVLEREDPRDALVLPLGRSAEPPPGARIGTGSIRRIAQLRERFPQARFLNVRGNLDTRLRKLDAGEYEALVLASAGLRRLGFSERISAPLPVEACIPAPGQGIIAIEIRSSDARTLAAVSLVNDGSAMDALDAERALVAALGGGCQMPVGALARPAAGARLILEAVVAAPDGSRAIRDKKEGPRTAAAGLGREAADALLRRGAAEILEQLQSKH